MSQLATICRLTSIDACHLMCIEGLWLGDRLITLKLVAHVRRYKSGADELSDRRSHTERNMYREHCTRIAAHALATPDNLVECVAFVLSTIQTPLSRVGHCMDDIRTNGAAAASLWGAKRTGYEYARKHAKSMHAGLVAAKRNGDVEFAIDCLSLIPSLGMVKAAFVAQLCGFEASCLDTHNLKRLGYSETAFKFPKTCSDKTRRAKIAAYCKVCRDHGGAEYFWDTWCEFVAAKGGQNKALDTAEKVSAYHVACFNLPN